MVFINPVTCVYTSFSLYIVEPVVEQKDAVKTESPFRREESERGLEVWPQWLSAAPVSGADRIEPGPFCFVCRTWSTGFGRRYE